MVNQNEMKNRKVFLLNSRHNRSGSDVNILSMVIGNAFTLEQ